MVEGHEATPDEARTIAARSLIKALDLIDEGNVDLDHVRCHVSDALIFLGIHRTAQGMFDALGVHDA